MPDTRPFGLKIAIISRAFNKKMDEKAGAMGLTSVQLRVLSSVSRMEEAGSGEIHQNDLERIEGGLRARASSAASPAPWTGDTRR